jgi:hypothetical protein
MFQVPSEIFFHLLLLQVHLPSVEALEFFTSKSLFLFILLLCNGQLLVSDLPELCELFLLLVILVLLLLLSVNLLLSASFNCFLHLNSPSLLLLE